MNRRPIIYWLNQLPDGYRERAIAGATRSGRLLEQQRKMTDALYLMGSWSQFIEGGSFWSSVCEHYEHRENPAAVRYVPLPQLPTT